MHAKPFLSMSLCLILTLAGLLCYVVRTRITPSSLPVEPDSSAVDKIELGMTEAEVAHLLGCPPGDYTRRRVAYIQTVLGDAHRRGVPQEWAFNSERIVVYFENGEVVGVDCGLGVRRPTWIEVRMGVDRSWLLGG